MRALLLVLLLGGCATSRMVAIDYSTPPPKDWPNLFEQINRVESSADLTKHCGQIPKGYTAESCVVFRFDYSLCEIYLTRKAGAAELEHERAHCKGYDHVGSSSQRDGWERIKANRKSR